MRCKYVGLPNYAVNSCLCNLQAYLALCMALNLGEHGAGSRLLHLLQITDIVNVMVVVSRWFGGILLGPDRFKSCLFLFYHSHLVPYIPAHKLNWNMDWLPKPGFLRNHEGF